MADFYVGDSLPKIIRNLTEEKQTKLNSWHTQNAVTNNFNLTCKQEEKYR